MEIDTGDRYLEHLVKFLDRNAGTLLDGTLTLKLNPVGLHYVQSRLDALQELEGLLSGAPVDYLRAYVSDLGDHRALEHLRRILGLLTSLKVISALPLQARDPTPLSLQAFGCLRVLELRGCDLSTSSPRGLLQLSHSLEKLICHNSTDALRHVFASRIADIKDSPMWMRLTFVSCAQNRLVLMDESLQLLPSVETLDLSRNQFAKVDNLSKNPKLQHLDLGFNHLRSITCLGEVSCPIVKLVLRNNALTTLRGLENLKLVEGLDLSYNLISSFSEIEILANLPRLKNLWLEGNPICYARWYRASVYMFFPHPESLVLDDCTISTKEYWERHIIYTRRQKQPSAYGFYFPAKDPIKEDTITHANPKKYSRLASIEDKEQRSHLCMESIEQDSLSCDSDMSRKDENTNTDHDLEIIDLMNKVEHLKKERSILWLRDLKDWMDQSSDQIDLNLHINNEQSRIPLIGPKHFGESSHSVSNMKQGVGGGSFATLNLEPCASNDGDYFVADLRSQEITSEQEKTKDDERNPADLSPLVVNDNSSVRPLAIGRREYSELSINPVRLTAIDEIIGSHSSSTFPGSPPHYQEDILHRRLNLEEEFLQLSTESQSANSSDSDTSCGEDELCGFNMSMSENGSLCIQDSTLDSSNHVVNHANDNHLGSGHVESHFVKGDTPVGRHYTELNNSNKTSSIIDNCVDTASCCSSGDLTEGARGIEKTDCKQQIKWGFVSFIGNLLSCNGEPKCEKVNGTLDSPNIYMKYKQGQSCFCENAFHYASRCGKEEQIYYVKQFFNSNVADSKGSETCQEVVFCGCIYEHGSDSLKSEVALLRSCKNKLYVLLIAETDGLGIVSRILGCYRLDEIREVVVGLGLQILRLSMERDSAYLLLTRTIEISKDLFGLLQIFESSSSTVNCCLKSWEQVQLDLLEKYVLGNQRTCIYFYSMILFWHSKFERKSWMSRSLFVIEGYLVVCTENFEHFGSALDFSETSPYYSFEALFPIPNIVEVVIDPKEDRRCLTLIAENVPSENIFLGDKMANPNPENPHNCKWKLKWFSEDYLLKFVSLLEAMYSGASSSSSSSSSSSNLHVICAS